MLMDERAEWAPLPEELTLERVMAYLDRVLYYPDIDYPYDGLNNSLELDSRTWKEAMSIALSANFDPYGTLPKEVHLLDVAKLSLARGKEQFVEYRFEEGGVGETRSLLYPGCFYGSMAPEKALRAQAAILHDVKEDYDLKRAEVGGLLLAGFFPMEISYAVVFCSDPPAGNRRESKRLGRKARSEMVRREAHPSLANLPCAAGTRLGLITKIYDRICNTYRSIFMSRPEWEDIEMHRARARRKYQMYLAEWGDFREEMLEHAENLFKHAKPYWYPETAVPLPIRRDLEILEHLYSLEAQDKYELMVDKGSHV